MKKSFTTHFLPSTLPYTLLLAVAASLSLAVNPQPPGPECPSGTCKNECEECTEGTTNATISGGMGADATQSGTSNPQGSPNTSCSVGDEDDEDDEDGDGSGGGGAPPEEEHCGPPAEQVGSAVSHGGLQLGVSLGKGTSSGCSGGQDITSTDRPYASASFSTGGSNFSTDIFSRGSGKISGLQTAQRGMDATTPRKIRWTRVGNSFAYFDDIPGSTGYDIKFYDSADVPGTSPGAAPLLRTVRIIQLPDETDAGVTVKVGRILESEGKKVREFRFKAPTGIKSWDLREGTFTGTVGAPGTVNLRIKTVVATATVNPTTYTETRIVTDITGGGSTVVKKEIDTYQTFAFSFGSQIRLIQNRVDPDTRNLTTLRYYYTSGPAEGKIMRVHYPSGDWRHYQYMADNDRLYRTFSPFGQTAPPASVSAVPPVAGAVIEESSFDSTPGWLRRDSLYIDDNIHRRTWSKKEGDPATTGVTWTVVQARIPSAAVTDSNNFKTVSVYYPEAPGVISSGRLKREETQDGQVRQYTYSVEAAALSLPQRVRVIEDAGPIAGTLGLGGLYTLAQGNRTIREKTMGGHFVREYVTDIATGKVLKDIIVDAADDFGRPTVTVDNLTLRTRYTSYACCGVQWEQDFDGLITGYGYDFQGNVIEEQKGYRPYDDNWMSGIEDWISHRTWERDVLGRVKIEKRIPHDPSPGTPQTIATWTYDVAGDVTQSTDAKGGIYYHRSQFISNQRVETTSHPKSGSALASATAPYPLVQLHRTEEKRYNRDGRLYSSRIYASENHCGAVTMPLVYTSGSGDIDNSVREYLTYTYSQGSVYFTVRVNNSGKSGGISAANYRITETDMLGRTYRIGRPNSSGTLIYDTHFYYTASEASSAGVPAAFGKLRRLDYADGRTLLYDYDARGRQLREITDYNNNNTAELATDRVVETVRSVVDGVGPLGGGAYKTLTSVYISGSTPHQVSEQIADASGLAIKVTAKGVTSLTTKTYSANGWWNVVTSHSDTEYGDLTLYGAGRLYFEEKRDSERFAYTYDSLGRLYTRTSQRTAEPVTYTYYENDQVHTIEEPSNGSSGTVTTTLTYDALGNLTGRTLPGVATPQTWTYNALGQMVESNGIEQYPVRYKYDDRRGRLRELTTGIGSLAQGAATWTYNSYGWLIQKRDAATPSKGVDYTYQANGLLATRQWARPLPSSATRVMTTYSWNAGTAELSGVTYNDAGVTPNHSFTFDRLGRLSSVIQGGNSWVYGYNPTTLLLDTETITYDTNPTLGGDFTRVLDRSQDVHQRNTGWELKNGGTTEHANTYNYGLYSGKFHSVTEGSDVFEYIHISYSAMIRGVNGPHNISVYNEWEARRDVLDYKENSNLSTTISKYDYNVNNLGRRTQVSQTGSAFGAGSTVDWGYNDRGEVDVFNHSNNSWDAAIEYDTAGNRIEARGATASLPLPGPDNFTANTLNQYTNILGMSLTYDEDGNLRTDGGANAHSAARTYSWNAENQLREVVPTAGGAAIGTYRYDPFGRRIARTVGGVTTWYIYDGWNLIAEYQGAMPSTALIRKHTWGLDFSGTLEGAGGVGGLLSTAILSGPGATATYYPVYDGNGNVTQYLNSSGTDVARYEYNPFGHPVTPASGILAAAFDFRFSTKKLDLETDVYYYGYRYYSSWMARWLNRDPVGEEGGVNLYGMVSNDTVNRGDMLGLKEIQIDKKEAAEKFGPPMDDYKRNEGSNCGGYGAFPKAALEGMPIHFTPSPKNMTTPIEEAIPDGTNTGAGCRSVKGAADCKKKAPDCERHVIVYTLDDQNFDGKTPPDYHVIAQAECDSGYSHQIGTGGSFRGPFNDPRKKAENYFDNLDSTKGKYKKIKETHYCCPKDEVANSKP